MATFTTDTYAISKSGVSHFLQEHSAYGHIVDGDIISERQLRQRALEVVNEWNRIAMLGNTNIVWHYVLKEVKI